MMEKKGENRERIVICGNYGATNIGDEAICLSLVRLVQNYNKDAEITIMSYDPSETLKMLRKHIEDSSNIKSVYLIPCGFRSLFRGLFKGELRKSLRAIKRCNKYILGGGGLFTDERLMAIFIWGMQSKVAMWYKKPVYMIGQSVGPLKTWFGKAVVSRLFKKARGVMVRDNQSKDLLKNLGVEIEIEATSDLVMILENKKTAHESSKLNKILEQGGYDGYFVVTIRNWGSYSAQAYKNIVQQAGQLQKQYNLLPVYLGFQLSKESDQALALSINEQINSTKGEYFVCDFKKDVFENLNLIKGAQFLVGMRLHSLIFAHISGIPYIGLPYSTKVTSFLKEANMDKYMVANIEHVDKLGEKVAALRQKKTDVLMSLRGKLDDFKHSVKIGFLKTIKK